MTSRPEKDSNVVIGLAFGVAAMASLGSGYCHLKASEDMNVSAIENPELLAQYTEHCFLEQVGHAIPSPSTLFREETLELTFSRAQAQNCIEGLVEADIEEKTHYNVLSGILGVAGIGLAGLGALSFRRNKRLDKERELYI